MMFYHHFFTWPDWWIEGIDYPLSRTLAGPLCESTKLCVSIFCFLTGYFYWFNKNKNLKYSLKKIVDIEVTYIVSFLIIALVGMALTGYRYGLADFIREAIGITNTTMLFCWYVSFYCLFMFFMPFITRILGTNVTLDLLLITVIFQATIRILIRFVNLGFLFDSFTYLRDWFPIVLNGYIFARYSIFERMNKLTANEVIHLIVSCICILFSFVTRQMIRHLDVRLIGMYYTFSFDLIYAPLFIYGLIGVHKHAAAIIKTVVTEIGRFSLEMWFVHCLFFSSYFREKTQLILYISEYEIVVYVWGVVICYILARLVSFVVEKITSRSILLN